MLDVVVDKAISAAKCGSGKSKAKLAVAGGVAANSELRRRLQAAGAENGVAVFCRRPCSARIMRL